jgi:hypothetical protein
LLGICLLSLLPVLQTLFDTRTAIRAFSAFLTQPGKGPHPVFPGAWALLYEADKRNKPLQGLIIYVMLQAAGIGLSNVRGQLQKTAQKIG